MIDSTQPHREKGLYGARTALARLDSVMKRLLFLLFVSLLTVSCSNETSLEVSEAGDNHAILPLSFDDFKSNPENYYGKYVKLEGMCVRVDKRGGSTMYMIGKDPSFEIEVAASDDVVRFTRYFEGRLMEVHGYVRHGDPVYVRTRSKESTEEGNDNITWSKPHYYIESILYKRIENQEK
jgi:hypothetical protein